MTNNNFKKLLSEAIKPLQEKQDEFKKALSGVKEDQTDLRKLIEERVLPPLAYIETTIKGYADSYVTNKDHIGRLNKRVATVEDKLGIQPPAELTIPTFD